MGVFVKGVVVANFDDTHWGGVVVAWRFGSLGDMRVKALSMPEGTDSGGAHESITFVSGRHAMLSVGGGCLAGITLTRTPAGWRLPLYWLAKRRPQSCFGEQSVSRLSTMMWQGLLCGIACIPALCQAAVTVCDGNPLALYWLPGDQTRTISNAEVVLSHSWRLSRCPACVLCSLRCNSLPHTVDRIWVCFSHTGDCSHVVSRGCAGETNG
jgi:hypothetical protein